MREDPQGWFSKGAPNTVGNNDHNAIKMQNMNQYYDYNEYGGESDMSDKMQKRPKDPIQAAKKAAKKKKEHAGRQARMMPFMMYAGTGRLMLTADNKRKIIKISQV